MPAPTPLEVARFVRDLTRLDWMRRSELVAHGVQIADTAGRLRAIGRQLAEARGGR